MHYLTQLSLSLSGKRYSRHKQRLSWLVGSSIGSFVRSLVHSFIRAYVRKFIGGLVRPVSKFLTRTITEDGLNEPGGKPWTRITNRIVKSQFEESASTILKTIT